MADQNVLLNILSNFQFLLPSTLLLHRRVRGDRTHCLSNKIYTNNTLSVIRLIAHVNLLVREYFDADGVGVDCIHKIHDVQPLLSLLTCPSCSMQPPRRWGGGEEDEDEITPEQMADLMEHFVIPDDASIAASALRFSVGKLVIYKPRGMMFGVLHAKNTVGWYEGEVMKVSQRMIYSEDRCGEYIAYIVWPRRDLPDDELGTEWVLEDTDEFIRPRPADLMPDSAKFKPLFVTPDDPYYYLYTDTKHFDSTQRRRTKR